MRMGIQHHNKAQAWVLALMLDMNIITGDDDTSPVMCRTKSGLPMVDGQVDDAVSPPISPLTAEVFLLTLLL